MNKFERLFGIKSSEIKKKCVLLPLATKEMLGQFGIGQMKCGKIYAAGESGGITFIRTGMGPAFTGDAVLYLKESPCEKLLLFGSCGLVNGEAGSDIGSLVSPTKCYELESFSGLMKACRGMARRAPTVDSGMQVAIGVGAPLVGALINKRAGTRPAPTEPDIYYPDKESHAALLKADASVRPITCATLGSLKLEEEMTGWFTQNSIDVVDMECSAFFAAAQYTGLKAAAVFYVSDILHTKPFYLPPDLADQAKITQALKKGSDLLKRFE